MSNAGADVRGIKTSNSPLRINILTSGRFHVLDLARELDALGHKVAFYSHVSRRRCAQFGLPARCHRSLLCYVLPLVVLRQKAPRRLRQTLDTVLRAALDHFTAKLLEPCDVFIGMSGLTVKSATSARERYHAKIFLERGSRHIISQKEILESIPGAKRPAVSVFDIDRELRGYEFADVISVPSRHVERSFVERGISSARIFRNPYGVDLTMFKPTEPPGGRPTVIFAGAWSLRKGCDVLWQACRAADLWQLVHVGPIGDAPVPRHALFKHHDAVPQWKLAEFYRAAHVFVHASREEGLSLVQAQALASGLPLVCTDRTGGEDLREMLSEPQWVTVVPNSDPEALRVGINETLKRASTQVGLRDILGVSREQFSWRAYGQRYDAEIRRRCARRSSQQSV